MEDLTPFKCTLDHRGFRCCPFYRSGSVVVDTLLIVASIVCEEFGFLSMSCYVEHNVQSSFAIIRLRNKDLVALL